MRCWGELKSLRGQSVGKVSLVMRAIFRVCGNQSQPGLQIVEKLATPLPGNDRSSGCARASDSHILTYLTFLSFIAPYPPPSIWSLVVDSKGPLQFPWVSLGWQQREKLGVSHDWRLEWIFMFSFQFPLWVEGYKARVSSSYFSLFFEHIPIFSYFKTKSSYFSCFLAGEAKICNKIENGIIVLCSLEWDWS